MASAVPICVICNTKSAKVTLFTDNTLEKCRNIKKIRLKNNLKYGQIELPSVVSTAEGYHYKCYKNFTALMIKYYKEDANEEPDASLASSLPSTSAEDISIGDNIETCEQTQSSASSHSTTTSSSQETRQVCILCNKLRKQMKGKEQILRTAEKISFVDNLKTQATTLNDFELLEKIEKSPNLNYHVNCRSAYQTKFQSCMTSKRENTIWHTKRNHHKIAFDELCTYIEDNIVKRRKCHLLSFLSSLYKSTIRRLLEEDSALEDEVLLPQHLTEKILKIFGTKIKIVNVHNHNIVAHVAATVDESTYFALKESDTIRETALTLRDIISKINKNTLPDSPTTTDLINGECTIPEELHEFFVTLLGGSNRRRRENSATLRKVKSLSEDTIYAVRNGQLKTSKHITLGMAMKSLTSSRKVIDILNRYGHCCSYNTVEELETEATFASSDRNSVCPQGIILSPNLYTGVAFDNFDRYVETCSGKDTLHDTVGIIFQNVTNDCDVNTSEIDNDDDSNKSVVTPGIKRRRSFEPIIPELASYFKKPKMVQFLLPNDDQMRLTLPDNLNYIKKIDLIWMLCHAFKIPDTPMWVGFNSKILQDNSHKQKVTYLTPINSSPTNTSVVLETMTQAQKVAEECHQPYIEITYDLAIAKVALQIQSTEHPKFDNIFIHLGSFHIMMAYFKAIGKFIDDCGLAYMMVESDLLANGSVNGFISGKHFNRCKRLHPIISLALQILHFKSFVEHEKLEIGGDVISVLVDLSQQKLSSPTVENEALAQILEKYSAYQEATIEGSHGKTAQFYMIYINLVNHYLTLARSVRTGDFRLFKYILPKIANLFFVFNQPNYARWLVKYHDNLLKIEETHPGLEENLQKGTYGVKRTDKSFSRQPVDLTLEQTINADAARRLTGVIHFTNSISARQRWARSHSIRSTLISHVYEVTGLQKSQDITGDLERHQIRKNHAALHKFMDTISKNMNPFRHDLDMAFLYNIATGRVASDVITGFLLTIEQTGNKLRENFILECTAANDRFEKPIKRNTISNFSQASEKKLVKIGNKIQEVKMQRDLFGRMLGILMEQNNVDIAKVLSYPLTPVPMSMCHLDGAICKTDKSAFMRLLEKQITSQSPQSVDIVILDGFFLLHIIKEVPKTFGNISKKILQMVTRFSAPRIDIVFDRYFSPSIKDNERTRRDGLNNRSYVISGPDQARPADFGKELKNTHFKEALVRFLITHWASEEAVSFIGNKMVHLNFDKCYSYKVVNGTVNKSIDEQLSCENQEEADTKIVYHVCHIDFDANVVIKCSDTDILVIMLGNMDHLRSSVHVWMDAGVGNNQRYIDITSLYNKLGESLARALPGFHAFTGCDYNPAFFKKGKNRPFAILQQTPEYQEAFSNLCNDLTSLDTKAAVFSVLEKYICHIYNIKRADDVNDARFNIFTKTFKAKDVNEPFSRKFKNFDATNLPPCKSELNPHLLRTHYISSLWGNAWRKNPTELLPLDHGWQERDQAYDFIWFEGEQLPSIVNDIIIQPIPQDNEINVTDDEEDDHSEDDEYYEDDHDEFTNSNDIDTT